ncbi:MAG: tetratricopeptide repeat protein [Candidatus Cloacimonadaceae bacterium]
MLSCKNEVEIVLIRYVPEFILHQLSLGKLQGSLQGFVLLLDIVDFTGAVEEYQGDGQSGADRAGKLLNMIFDAPIKAILRHQGFVNLFMGDAVFAIFAGENPDNLLAAIQEINGDIPPLQDFKRTTEHLNIALHKAISFGEINWEIFPTDYQYEYLFSGKPFIEVSEAISHHSRIIYTETAQAIIGRKRNEAMPAKPAEAKSENMPALKPEFARARSALFLHKRFSGLSPAHEIRAIVPCFVKLEQSRDISQAIKQIHFLADRYHGFVNKIEHSENGAIILIIFGAPISDGKSILQGGNFSLAAVESIPGISIGLCCGFAFTGCIVSSELREYTGLGHAMNIASRLMNLAKSGEVLCDQNVWQELHESYHLQFLEAIKLKGVGKAIRYYRLQQRIKGNRSLFKHSFVGRNQELELLSCSINEAIAQRQSRILYISGEPGQGKSRLAFECLKSFEQHRQITVYCQKDSHRQMQAITQIIRELLGLTDNLSAQKLKDEFELSYQHYFGKDESGYPEKSTLASLLDLEYSASLWQGIQMGIRPDKQAEAFGQFMRFFVSQAPLLMMIDDAQWLDAPSLALLQDLSFEDSAALVILATCRSCDDGSRVDLPLPHFKALYLGLEKLPEADANSLLKQLLQVPKLPNNNLELIYSRSGGNPFFMEQLTMHLMEKGLLEDSAKLCKILSKTLNFGISDVINSRIDSFSKSMQECLYSASVLGMQFSVKALAIMLNQIIEVNLQNGLKHRLWISLSELQYTFSHVLLRDTIYHRMVSEKTASLHKLAAETLVKLHKEDFGAASEEIAHHYENAKEFEAAISYFRKAADHSMHYSTWQKAIVLQRKAVILGGKHYGFGSVGHIEELFWLALHYHYIQHYQKAEPLYLRVVKLRSEDLGSSSALLSPYLNNLGRFYKDTARYEMAEELLRKSLRIEHIQDPRSTNVADRLNNLATLFAHKELLPKAMSYSRLSLKLFQECQRDDKEYFVALLQNNIANLYIRMNELEKAEEYSLLALSALERMMPENSPSISHCYHNLFQISFKRRQYDLAEAALDKAMQKISFFFGKANPEYARCLICQGDLLWDTEDKVSAKKTWQEALEILRQTTTAGHPLMQRALQRLAKQEQIATEP